MGEYTSDRYMDQKPQYEKPKALRLDDLNRGQGGQHGSVVGCTVSGSGDSICGYGSLSYVDTVCITGISHSA